MSLVEKVRAISIEQMRELAETIEGELKAECPSRSGEAREAIHIEEIDDTHIFVGGKNSHLFFADQGNNQRFQRLTAKHKSYTRKGNPRTPMLGEYPGGIPGIGWRASVSTYEGKHFVREVADRHR